MIHSLSQPMYTKAHYEYFSGGFSEEHNHQAQAGKEENECSIGSVSCLHLRHRGLTAFHLAGPQSIQRPHQPAVPEQGQGRREWNVRSVGQEAPGPAKPQSPSLQMRKVGTGLTGVPTAAAESRPHR